MSEFVLWGSHPDYADGVPIKLIGGTESECEAEQTFRMKLDGAWKFGIYAAGVAPIELRHPGYRVWHTADLLVPDCEGGCPEADACERGWVDMSWSAWTVYDERDDVRPDEYDPDACSPRCTDAECAPGHYSPSEWLADRLWELPGGADGWNYGETFYAADTDRNFANDGRWEEASRAIHAEGFSDEELCLAWAIYQQRSAAFTYHTWQMPAYYGAPDTNTPEMRAQDYAAQTY